MVTRLSIAPGRASLHNRRRLFSLTLNNWSLTSTSLDIYSEACAAHKIMWSKAREIADGDTIIVWMVRPKYWLVGS
jgi:hypothetical protein